MKRGQKGQLEGNVRVDDNFETALQRLRTFHKYHKPTMDWLREQHGKFILATKSKSNIL